ncbi:MAG: hypothetical protein NW217_08790 [Hyphomicrobiaceae bacterium]|nr:hypothetical protein [Hyphomicrobiaceae bacterium]
MTAAIRRQVKIRGVIPPVDTRPPFFAHLFQLYRTELLFRSLVDLAVIGLVVVSFKADWSDAGKAVRSALDRAATAFTQPLQPSVRALHTQLIGPGSATIDAIGDARVDRDALTHSGEVLSRMLVPVADALDRGAVEHALQLVSALDDRDATVAYVKAVVLLHRPGAANLKEARQLLRRATERAVYPAYVLAGEVAFKLVMLDENGRLPAALRFTVDDAGQTHPATPAELSQEAAMWWERAASFGRPAGVRLFALARARGLSGRPDLVAAAALWRQASDAGDAISQLELANMRSTGQGIQQDIGEAIRLYRLAQSIPMARLRLAIALSSRAVVGDEAAAREAIEHLEQYVTNEKKPDLRGMGHYMLGLMLYQIAPASIRDLRRGLMEFEAATRLGNAEAAYMAGKAHSAGVVMKRDPACAHAFLSRSRTAKPPDLEQLLATLDKELSASDRERRDRIALDLRAQVQTAPAPDVIQSWSSSRRQKSSGTPAAPNSVCERIA